MKTKNKKIMLSSILMLSSLFGFFSIFLVHKFRRVEAARLVENIHTTWQLVFIVLPVLLIAVDLMIILYFYFRKSKEKKHKMVMFLIFLVSVVLVNFVSGQIALRIFPYEKLKIIPEEINLEYDKEINPNDIEEIKSLIVADGYKPKTIKYLDCSERKIKDFKCEKEDILAETAYSYRCEPDDGLCSGGGYHEYILRKIKNIWTIVKDLGGSESMS